MSPAICFLSSFGRTRRKMERSMGREGFKIAYLRFIPMPLMPNVIDKNADQTVPLPELKL